jgi:putative transposase
MPRAPRHAPPGWTYHVLNRAVARLRLFRKPADYDAFERVVEAAHERVPINILAYCVMPNHWHFVLRPDKPGQLTDFLRWLTHTHTMRWHAYHHTSGSGHLYQGRFKAFPIEEDEHFYTVVRYGKSKGTQRLCRKP